MGIFDEKMNNEDVEMTDEYEAENGDGNGTQTRKRKPWEKPDGTKMKRKKVPGAKNLKIRRYVKPKNAAVCLNELVPGLVYETELDGSVHNPFCVAVEVEGQTYRGYGSSRQLAKQAAAEAALISFVKPPTAAGSEEETPWATLASFAIYKLFFDWREGRLGSGDKAPVTNVSEALSAHLEEKIVIPPTPGGVPAAQVEEEKATASQAKKIPKPAKQIPDNASAMHPVSVLHQMNPGLTYNMEKTTKENKPHFVLSTVINEETFTGEGSSAKKAKFALAKDAMKWLYGIESTFEAPA
ncbi:double-stranded RNA-specific editase 1-like [Oratosquilla oratoria]|uniref:double-stranded RNA-specific editase 1-like n=1 Tax=Oratosquilla oratoria TaxID=337810 RepID=UPI003F7764C5